MRIAFVGLAGSGKDHAASILVNEFAYERVAFADHLKAMVGHALNRHASTDLFSAFRSDSEAIAWVEAHKREPAMRGLLQAVGVGFREYLDSEYWIDAALAKIEGYEASLGKQDWVLTDCRFENEAAALRECGFWIVRVLRPSHEALSGELAAHVSETEQARIKPDAILYNPGDERYRGAILALLEDLESLS